MLSAEYWASRALDSEAIFDRAAQRTIRDAAKAYETAFDNIRKDMRRLLQNYGREGGLTEQEAKKRLNTVEADRVIYRLTKQIAKIQDPKLRKELLSRIHAPVYRASLSRLQALQDSIEAELAKVAEVQQLIMKDRFIRTMEQSYYRTLWNAQTGTGLGFSFTLIPRRAIEKTLAHNWSGKHYSERVWDNTELTAEKAKEILQAGLLSGRSVQRMSRDLAEGRQSGAYAAARLIRTENNYFHNQGTAAAYEEIGLKRYRFLATLDLRTSKLCRELDRKVFPTAEAVVGENYPPMHPNCRSTTCPELGDKDYSRLQRRARDPVTGKPILVPADMTYNEWYDKYVKGNPEAELQERMTRNRSADKNQFARYSAALGAENMPQNLADFQRLKYTDEEGWRALKGFMRYKKAAPMAERYHYDIYNELRGLGIKKGLVLPPERVRAFIESDPRSSDPDHIFKRMFERGITANQIQEYIETSVIMFEQWGGQSRAYYGYNGATVIHWLDDHWIAKTTWNNEKSDRGFDNTMKVIKKYVK